MRSRRGARRALLFIVLGLPLVVRAEPQSDAALQAIRYTVRFRYGPDPEDKQSKQRVLLVEEQFENTSPSQTFRLSFWAPATPRFGALDPGGMFVRKPANPNPGTPRPPSREDLVALAPGGTHRMQRWYWPTADLPFRDASNEAYYRARRSGLARAVLCRHFGDDGDAYRARLGADVGPLDVGTVCTAPTPYDVRILMRDP